HVVESRHRPDLLFSAKTVLQHQNPGPPNLLESNITIREGPDEKDSLSRGANRLRAPPGRDRHASRRDLPQARRQRADLLPLTKEICWYGHPRAPSLAPAGRRKPHAQATRGQFDPRQTYAPGGDPKKA